jgi:hypothetical protein
VAVNDRSAGKLGVRHLAQMSWRNYVASFKIYERSFELCGGRMSCFDELKYWTRGGECHPKACRLLRRLLGCSPSPPRSSPPWPQSPQL